MTITYNNDIPATNNDPSVDQPDMRVNTNSVDQFLAVDHVPFNSNDFPNGYHNVIHQPPQSSNPAVIPGYGQTFVKTVSGDQELFYESGNGVVTQLTLSNQSIIRNTIDVKNFFKTLATLPADCVGYLVIQLNNLVLKTCTIFPFFTDAGVGYIQQTLSLVGTESQLTCFFSGLDLQVEWTAGNSDYTAIYKIIYWNG